MKNFWSVCFLAVFSFVGLGTYKAHSEGVFPKFFVLELQDFVLLRDTVGICSDRCVITENPGGSVELFTRAAEVVKRRNMPVVIDGKCYSACVVFADAAQSQVCITHNTTFYLHLGTRYRVSFYYYSFPSFFPFVLSEWPLDGEYVWVEDGRAEPPQSPPIRKWVMVRGGFPAKGFLRMYYKEAKRFWPTCK